jgi:hypothetical protein
MNAHTRQVLVVTQYNTEAGFLFLVCIWLTWGPWTWASFSVSLSAMYRNTDHWLLLVSWMLPLTHWISPEIHIPEINLFNIWPIASMERISGQPQVKLPIAQYFFKVSTTSCWVEMAGNLAEYSRQILSPWLGDIVDYGSSVQRLLLYKGEAKNCFHVCCVKVEMLKIPNSGINRK